MGNCASPQHTKTGDNNNLKWPAATAKIIYLDGRLQEFKQPIKAKHILSQNLNCFLSSSESMCMGSQIPHVTEDEELQLGQIYFLMPLSKSQATLTLKDLCSLAVKASAALSDHQVTTKGGGSYKHLAATPQVCCEVQIGFPGSGEAQPGEFN